MKYQKVGGCHLSDDITERYQYQRDRKQAYSVQLEKLAGDTLTWNVWKWNTLKDPRIQRFWILSKQYFVLHSNFMLGSPDTLEAKDDHYLYFIDVKWNYS